MDSEEYTAELRSADIALNDAHDYLDVARTIAGDASNRQVESQISAFQDNIRSIIEWIENQ